MSHSYLEFDPEKIERHEIYRLLTGAVVPRPIGWASTINSKGVTNLAPFSFFTVVCVAPPMISLTIARNPDGTEKHTLKNAKEMQEFCFNVVTTDIWKEMVDSANGIPEEDSEFDTTGLTAIPSVKNQVTTGQGGTDSFRMQAPPGYRTRSQQAPSLYRRSRSLSCRSRMHERQLYRCKKTRSGWPVSMVSTTPRSERFGNASLKTARKGNSGSDSSLHRQQIRCPFDLCTSPESGPRS